MKKILTFMVALLTAFNLFAQDIIITSDAKRIEAKILEVSSNEIKYKEFNNLEGPTFILTSDELNTIIYHNGTIKTFDHSAKQAPQPVNNAGYNSYSATPVAAGLPITKEDDDIYVMGDLRMSEDDYLKFIKLNCKDAYTYYENGVNLQSLGFRFLGAGAGLFAGGLVWHMVGLFTFGPYASSSYLYDYGLYKGFTIAGEVLMGVGLFGFIPASVPCLVIGTVRKNNSHEVYNEKCAATQQAKNTPVTFGITSGANGIGVALNF